MAKLELPIVLDFETYPIKARPDYPPKPVGASIFLPGDKKPVYYSWGHPTGNNCTRSEGERAIKAIYSSGQKILCHHGKFDLDVAETHMGLALPEWERCEDTMFLLFLFNPHSPNLKLKPAAAELLGMPPEEQDKIRDWAIEQKLMPRTRKEAGEFIYLAPGTLVGPYANGDTIRTRKLFQFLYPKVKERGMLEAYNRERRLLPVLLKQERVGVQMDTKLMSADAKVFKAAGDSVDAWLRKMLKAKDINLDSDTELAEALVNSGRADEELFLVTPGGKLSTAKDSLMGAVTDKRVLSALQYRSKLGTAYGTFLMPWLTEAEKSSNYVRPAWNQVRTSGAAGDAGARTGRLSASRFMNVPKEFKEKKGKFDHPDFIKGLPHLPFMRRYMLPDKGQIWCKRDYAQQELRVLGHFEDGILLRAYLENPNMDIHQVAADMIVAQFGMDVNRDIMKTIGFALLYGMGLGALAERLDCSVEEAKQLKNAYLAIFPGLKDLQDELKVRGQTGLPLRTWGGREYFVEEPKYSEKHRRLQTFEYKLLNYLIQGSSADCTKEAIIRYDSVKRDGRLLMSVHDEISMSVPPKAVKTEMALLREVMLSIEFDVPMLSDGGVGKNWGDLEKFKEPVYG